MFTRPKTWTQGESGIRAESVNNGLPNNLEAVRSLAISHTAVSASYPGSTMTFPEVFVEGAFTRYSFPSMYVAGNAGVWTGAEAVGANAPAGVVWIPLAGLLAAKKTTENVVWNIEVTARPINVSRGRIFPPESGRLGALGARVAYQYLGSELDVSPGPVRTITVNSLDSTDSYRAIWRTGNINLNTQDMSNTNVSLCAFRIYFDILAENSTNYFGSVGAKDFTLTVNVGLA